MNLKANFVTKPELNIYKPVEITHLFHRKALFGYYFSILAAVFADTIYKILI